VLELAISSIDDVANGAVVELNIEEATNLGNVLQAAVALVKK